MEMIKTYFPDLTDRQLDQLEMLLPLYKKWNAQINVISRKDIDQLYLHHVLHSMSIAKWMKFNPGSLIMDLGCGGGFPGIPLAIMYPDVLFHEVDSIGKKLKVIDAIIESLDLQNVRTYHRRAENMNSKYDFVITRAVAKMPQLINYVRGQIADQHINALPNGLIALKGGHIDEEINPLKKREYIEIEPINTYFSEDYFNNKYIIYIQM